ncbi:OPT oligopeptide transporter [Apiospora arundinis]|uniref:OPT oligopeptide transporter n=1 Tax=Apiospora arundinis TaxID=335852 RepID=A0ABR2JGW8_9PEZI
MPSASEDIAVVVGAFNPVEGKVVEAPTHPEVNETRIVPSHAVPSEKDEFVGDAITAAISPSEVGGIEQEKDRASEDVIIITGADAAHHLLPMRDDGDPAITFRGMVLATIFSGFQAVMYQIYQFKPTNVTISGTFITLIAYFVGNAWANFLPRGDLHEARWRERGGTGKRPWWITVLAFLNNGPWGLKEHAICAITATSASNAADTIKVFAAQDLFYNLPLSATTIILSLVSIGLFGYGLCGLMRPVAVWHVEAVYWSTLPTVKALQGLHWQHVKDSKPIRYFWYAFGGMFIWEWFPAYMWPWLNAISIPCLASMKATGTTAATLTNIFGGSLNNEGLGLFSISLDWQYITSFNTSLPLKLQYHMAAGFSACFVIMAAIYWGDAWGSRSLPFMSTLLRSADGSKYPITKVFVNGVLDETMLEKYGIPRLAGTMAYGLFIANAAIGALIAHCVLFWGKDIVRAYKSARKGEYNDPHHTHMAKHYQETPWWWYVAVLVISFVLGLVVVIKENITLPVWAYIVALLVGSFVAPFSTLLYSRYGNGIATNNLSKMIAGLCLPGLPIGNMYFAVWSHNVISNAVTLSNDLKMGEYLKIPPRAMFLTQIYGTVLGGFLNYAVMIAIVTGNRELLASSNGDASWSGATLQAYNTNAASWALAKYFYTAGAPYVMVTGGIAIGAAVVIAHRILVIFLPKVRNFSLYEINMAQFIQFAGYIPYNQSQTCVIFSQLIAGFFVQFYLRNYKPRVFRDYSYLVTAAFDGAALLALFILSFAVFGAGGPARPFPKWWGNNVDGNYDLCPVAE